MKNREKIILVAIPIIVAIVIVAFSVWTLQNMTNPNMANQNFNYKIVDVESYPQDTIVIMVKNFTGFEECVRALQGSDAIVFRVTMLEWGGIVYFFPYQGYLIMYAEPQE